MKALYTNDTAKGPGNGFLQITEADQISSFEGITFGIKRASDQKSLGMGGWQPAESFLAPHGISLGEEGVALVVGPEVVDHLDSQETYRITLKGADGATAVSSLRVPEVAYSLAVGGQGIGSTAKPEPKPTPPPPPPPPPMPTPEPLPMPEPEPMPEALPTPPPAPEKKGSKLPLIIGILVLLLAGGGIGAWMHFKDKSPAPVAAAPKPFIAQAREHLAGKAEPAASLEMAEKFRGEKDGADAAFLLAEDAAQKGDAKAMLITGSFYDPADTSPAGSIVKDPLEAFSWYTKAQKAGNPDAQARIDALKKWAEAEAAKGSAAAKDLLKKF